MPEQVKKILDRFLEWWKKFETKQKALLISIIAVIVLALVILGVVVSRPSYVTIVTCEDTKKASEVKELFDKDGSINYKVSDDGLTFKVVKEDEANATILLGKNDIPSDGYSIENVTSGSFSTTEADKQKKYQLYLEKKFAEHLKTISHVKDAKVDLKLPSDDGTISSKKEQGYASIVLDLSKDLDEDQAYGIAQFVATELGNEDTSNVMIIDTKANVLYAGTDSENQVGAASSKLSYQQKQEAKIKKDIKDLLVKSKTYSNVEVSLGLKLDFDDTESVQHNFSAPEGQTNGMVGSVSEYGSESTGGPAAEPGTGSNDDTTYQTQDGNTTSSTISDKTTNYQNNEEIIKKKNSGGTIKYSESTASIKATQYVVYDEKKMKSSGELKGQSFDEFVSKNSKAKTVKVTKNMKTLIAKATGLDEANIEIQVLQQPEFVYDDSSISVTDILQIVLAVLIFALLGYVVFRSTQKAKEVEEVEPEVSVESLLQQTEEAEKDNLENIGYQEKSETRRLIEQFVDDNPEAVALLLRNWLNEDWE